MAFRRFFFLPDAMVIFWKLIYNAAIFKGVARMYNREPYNKEEDICA